MDQFTLREVKEILSAVTDADPEPLIASWRERKSLEKVDEDKYRTFVLSFPVEVDGRVVATVTLADLFGNQSAHEVARTMSKYMGPAEYAKAHEAFSHETYKFCFIQVHEEFSLPEVVTGLEALQSQFTDAAGNRVAFTLLWGYPDEGADPAEYQKWKAILENRRTYRFDSSFSLLIEGVELFGLLLGEEVNRRIAARSRERKIVDALSSEKA